MIYLNSFQDRFEIDTMTPDASVYQLQSGQSTQNWMGDEP